MNRRLRLALGGVAALAVAGALVAPVVIGSGGSNGSCAMTLYYSGRPYAVRAVDGANAVQAIAIGVGSTQGCGQKPENVDVRSLAGIPAARAVALSGESGVWVRKGVCAGVSSTALLSCLKR